MSKANLIAKRIAEWTEVCRMQPPPGITDLRTPRETFEDAIRAMQHAGCALPREVVAGVRKNLRREG